MRHARITQVITPAASLDLVPLDAAKAVLGVPLADTSKDAAIGQHISAVSSAINNYCDRVFVIQGYRDQIRNAYGFYGEPLVTRQYPIAVDSGGVPLVAVTEDGVALDPTMLEVYLETGSIYRLDGSSAPAAWATPTMIVDYTAGFDPVPADVQGACLEWISVRWYAVGRDPSVRSETIPDLITQVYGSGSDTSAATAMPGGVRDWLTPYRIWTV
jgi:hypothetical protein